MCLDADHAGTTNGTRVLSWPCGGQDNQKWTFGQDGSIRNVHSGLCLDVEGAATANGTHAILWTCNGQANQNWARA
jgi:alpha-galactosidase